MLDRNIQNFHRRLGRIAQIRAAGGGFEAAGALGMSHYNALRRPARPRSLLMPLLLVALTVIALKAAIFATVGPATYDARVTRLQTGSTIERLGGQILHAEPLTVALGGQLRRLVH